MDARLWQRLTAFGRDMLVTPDMLTNRSMSGHPIWGRGDRRPVIVLHGFMSHATSMERFAESAVQRGHAVAAPQWTATDSVRYQAAGLVDLLGRMDESAHLVGHSLGGVVAVKAAVDRPELVASIASIASPLGGSHLARLPLVRQSALVDAVPARSAARHLREVPVPLFSVAGEFDPLVPVKSALALASEDRSLVVPEGLAALLWRDDVVNAIAMFQESVDSE